MPNPADLSLHSPAARRRVPTAAARLRAETHAAPHGSALAAALLVYLAGSGCSGGSDAAEAPAAGSAARVTADIAELVEAFQTVDPVATSDVHDRALQRQRELVLRLRQGDRALGKAAFAAFRTHAKSSDKLREALLEISAVCDPAGMAPVLEPMIVTYDPELGLGLRTYAVGLLAEISPERAMALIEPLLLDERIVTTLPPRETFVRSWAAAARATGRLDLRVLCDVAVDIAQPPDARVAAVSELGAFGGRPSALALEAVLFEAASDAYLRRKAAQSLVQFLPPEELCPLLERAVEHEHDMAFLRFVSDLAAAHCP